MMASSSGMTIQQFNDNHGGLLEGSLSKSFRKNLGSPGSTSSDILDLLCRADKKAGERLPPHSLALHLPLRQAPLLAYKDRGTQNLTILERPGYGNSAGLTIASVFAVAQADPLWTLQRDTEQLQED